MCTQEHLRSWGPNGSQHSRKKKPGRRMEGKAGGRQRLDQVGTLGSKEFGFCSVRRDAFSRGLIYVFNLATMGRTDPSEGQKWRTG